MILAPAIRPQLRWAGGGGVVDFVQDLASATLALSSAVAPASMRDRSACRTPTSFEPLWTRYSTRVSAFPL